MQNKRLKFQVNYDGGVVIFLRGDQSFQYGGSNQDQNFWCKPAFFGNAGNYVTAFPKNAENSLHQKC